MSTLIKYFKEQYPLLKSRQSDSRYIHYRNLHLTNSVGMEHTYYWLGKINFENENSNLFSIGILERESWLVGDHFWTRSEEHDRLCRKIAYYNNVGNIVERLKKAQPNPGENTVYHLIEETVDYNGNFRVSIVLPSNLKKGAGIILAEDAALLNTPSKRLMEKMFNAINKQRAYKVCILQLGPYPAEFIASTPTVPYFENKPSVIESRLKNFKTSMTVVSNEAAA